MKSTSKRPEGYLVWWLEYDASMVSRATGPFDMSSAWDVRGSQSPQEGMARLDQ